MFLEGNGFEYVLKVFMSKQLKAGDVVDQYTSPEAWFNLKHMAFLLKLLRIFIMAAFSTSAESAFEGTSLIRKTNVNQELAEDSGVKHEVSRFEQL
jgi:uncharacterized protein YPO0396